MIDAVLHESGNVDKEIEALKISVSNGNIEVDARLSRVDDILSKPWLFDLLTLITRSTVEMGLSEKAGHVVGNRARHTCTIIGGLIGRDAEEMREKCQARSSGVK
ncbi:hypothetical protein TKK_0013305 [Trichogramma kaykai]